jgi:hypothetical protein
MKNAFILHPSAFILAFQPRWVNVMREEHNVGVVGCFKACSRRTLRTFSPSTPAGVARLSHSENSRTFESCSASSKTAQRSARKHDFRKQTKAPDFMLTSAPWTQWIVASTATQVPLKAAVPQRASIDRSSVTSLMLSPGCSCATSI